MKRKQEDERKSAAQAKRQELEEKKKAVAAAALARRQDFEAKKKQASAKVSQAEKPPAEKSEPRPTLSLFGFGQPQSADKPVSKAAPAKTAPAPVPVQKASAAPRGVPTITGWRQNRDGSISGRIFGSPNFGEGEAVTTSPITGDGLGGTVVETSSGSR